MTSMLMKSVSAELNFTHSKKLVYIQTVSENVPIVLFYNKRMETLKNQSPGINDHFNMSTKMSFFPGWLPVFYNSYVNIWC